MAEFDLIEKYFAPLADEGARGLLDDGAVLDVPAGKQLVISSDTSNCGDHLPLELSPQDTARKALRSNLSDLTAMGADPWIYQLNLALPKEIDEEWLAGFAEGLKGDQEEYGIMLSGGDTTGMPEGDASVAITIIGLVPTGEAVSRGGAKPGDLAVLTGTIGGRVVDLLHVPTPPKHFAPLVRQYAHAAIDISDGIPLDVGHICEVSGVGAQLELDNIPLSEKAQAAIQSGDKTPQEILTWGEEYQIAMAVPPEHIEALQKDAAAINVPLSIIGEFTEGEVLEVLDSEGVPLVFDALGWQHF